MFLKWDLSHGCHTNYHFCVTNVTVTENSVKSRVYSQICWFFTKIFRYAENICVTTETLDFTG